MKNAKAIYRRFVEFEERAATLYLKLASQFSSNPKLSWFWIEMALEEKQHAGLLQFCIGEGLFAPELPSDSQIERLSAMFKELEKRASDPKLSPDDAFSLAIEMESFEINAIYCCLTATVHTSPYLLKRKIATFEPNHLRTLIAAARKFGISKKVLKEANRLRKPCGM